MLKVSKCPDGRPEIFYSVQGEGVNTGRPAIFLRLALCNLACVWCDTSYTWDWEHYDINEQVIEMTPEEVEQAILKYDCRHVVITGGEPMLQQRQLLSLLESLKNKDFYVEIETNGTIMPDPVLASLVRHWSISPKLSNSGNTLSKREVPQVYEYFRELSNSHFKYVINNRNDVKEVHGVISKYNLAPERIILMPESRNRAELVRKSSWLVDICKEYGYIFSTRLQLLLWGNKRAI